jgi:arylsulfatase A-like enzyme
MQTRQQIRRLAMASVILQLISFEYGQKMDTPNILWIIGEDIGPELACYGHPQVWTPNLDKLAVEGALFSHAYTTAPVCSPSRSAFITGMYQTSIGAHNHRSHRSDGYRLPEGVQLITDRLRKIGYFTANIRDLTGDELEKFFRGTGKTDWNFHYPGEPFDSDQWSDLKSNQPFYAQINFAETHRGAAWDNSHLHIERTADPKKVVVPPYYPNHPIARQVWAQYLNTVMALDKKVGFVINRLTEDELLENTVIIFFGDNGRAMVRAKQWPYESGLHIPLIIRWPEGYAQPDGFRPGSVNAQLIASIDLTATSLAIAGILPPLGMQGKVFLGKKAVPPREYVFGGRDRGDETVDRIRTVRDERYRYIRNFYPEKPFLQLNRYKEWTYPIIGLLRDLFARGELDSVQARLVAPTRPEEELYDLLQDPYEIKNLASQPEYQATKTRLSTALDVWMQETNDQGWIKEPAEIIDFWEAEMKRNYESRPKKTIDR